ncbi:MAG: O-antigen ligase family protein, partial [Parcubacteria group bacterium]
MEILENRLNKISWLLIQAGIIFIPLWVNIFAFNAYENKIFIFIGLTDALFVLWLIKKRRLKNILLYVYNGLADMKLWSLNFLLICYLLVYSLATIFSINAANSFFGNEYRMFGLLFIGHAILFFFLLKPRLTAERCQMIFKILSFASIPICVYAILQYFRIDFSNYLASFVVINNGTLIMRSFSTFGHPNYLATYLAMILPFSFYLFFINKKPASRLSYALIILIQFLSLIFTMTRSAWFAVVISLAFFFFSIFKLTKSRKTLTILAAAMIIFAIAVGAIGFKRINQPISDSSLSLRLTEWRYASQQILKRPLFGYGPDNYQILSVQRQSTPLELKIDAGISDRVHNILLDTAINIGLTGLIIYLLIWVKAVQLWRREFKKNNLISCAIFASLLACFLILFFNFDFSVSLI